MRYVMATLVLSAMLLVNGCHYYIRATPDIVISDQPITQPPNGTNLYQNAGTVSAPVYP
jgi:hypothetical protein